MKTIGRQIKELEEFKEDLTREIWEGIDEGLLLKMYIGSKSGWEEAKQKLKRNIEYIIG